MPVPAHSKYDRDLSPPSMSVTPARQNFSRISSTTTSTSYTPTVTNGGQIQKLNVVTRVAIEGKAKRGQDGASVRMFLKIAVPLDSPHVAPGATISLFPEENIKVLSSQVHPLDHNSVPYNFSADVSPLLYNAARALGLPARSAETFESAFQLSKTNGTPASSRFLKSESGEIAPTDVQYTGQILVSGYNVAFILPKILQRGKFTAYSDYDDESQTPMRRRRSSIGERNQAQFMAAIDMWIPFLGKPPRSPYLLSIPTPRCLHNQIKLRIFPPVNTSASMASLSSLEDEGNAWDLTSDPHVTRTTSTRPSRSHSYSHFADDESSDSSTTGTSDACIVQGTFPSAERIRVRWAKPMKSLNIPGFEQNGRRRVGVEEVKGEMICSIGGRGTSASNPDVEGILMHVEYTGHCKGVWFPGVATLLGLDIGLEAKGSDLSWPQGHSNQWEVSGNSGYTGFDVGSASNPHPPASRTPSFEADIARSDHDPQRSYQTARTSSTSSTSSLLRAPLPARTTPDYSFEGSNTGLSSSLSPAGTLSSMSSLPGSSTTNLPSTPQPTHPGSPITLHLNVNDLAKNTFSFTVSGTVLVTARASLSRVNALSVQPEQTKGSDLDPVVLPRFTVLAADKESTSITVRNDADSVSLEVFHPTGDMHNDPQTRKTVLQKGGFTKCGDDGGRIALKQLDAMSLNGVGRPTNRPRTPSNNSSPHVSTTSPIIRSSIPARGKREGPPMISSVQAQVTFLNAGQEVYPSSYAVRVKLESPALADPEWLEFGFSKPPSSSRDVQQSSRVHLICASLDGVPVRSELTNTSKGAKDQSASFECLTQKDWLSWGKIYTGTSVGGSIVLDYIVQTSQEDSPANAKGKSQAKAMDQHIHLPTFFASVARFEVLIDPIPGFQILPSESNFNYHHGDETTSRLLQYSLEEFAQSQLTITISKSTSRSSLWSTGSLSIMCILLVLLSLWPYRPVVDIRPLRDTRLDQPDQSTPWNETPPVTVTTTLTLYASSPTATACWAAESSSTTTALSSTIYRWTSSSNSYLPLSTSSTLTTHQESSLTTTPPRQLFENFGLVPIQQLLRFSFSDEQKQTFRTIARKVVDTLDVVWTIARQVYHYPLDPP